MSAFFGQHLLAAGFFKPNYLHGAVQVATNERSGWWRLWLAQETQRQLDIRNAKIEQKIKEEEKPEVKVVSVQKKVKTKPKKNIKIIQHDVQPYRAPVIPLKPREEPMLHEYLGTMDFFTEYSPAIYKQAAKVIELAAHRKKRKKREEEEFLFLLAA